MVQYAARVGLAGAAFFFLQLWEGYRGKQSYDRFINERENPGVGRMTLQDWLIERRRAVPPPPPLLNVNNFGVEQMEGAKATPNSASRL